MKRFASACGWLILGGVVGWMLRGPAVPSAPIQREPIRDVAHAERIIAANSAAVGTAGSATVEPPKFTPTDRVKSLAAVVSRGRYIFRVDPLAGNKLSPGFVEMYGLTDAEAASLSASLAAANSRLTAIALGLATSQLDEEKKQLSVHVPPFPEEGGVVRDQAFAAFKTVLGPERYAAFNVLSADGLETAFNSFGLNDTTYVMKLVPSSPGRRGDAGYVIDMKYTTGNGNYGTSGNMMYASQIPEAFPVLARFVPAGIIPPKK